MEGVEIIGYIAAAITMIATTPQVVKIIKTKDASGVSYPTYVLTILADLAWLIYGIISNNWPIIVSDAGALLLAVIVLICKFKFDKG